MKEIYIKDLEENKNIELYCWISNKRRIKNTLFLDVYDSTGTIQAIANRSNCINYDELVKIGKESAIKIDGNFITFPKKEFIIKKFEVLAKSNLNLSPSPNEKSFDIFSSKLSKQVIEHPTFYIRNKKLSKIYYIKSVFKRELQNYFWNLNFVEFESPTLTKQTLYDDSGAIWLIKDHQNISLSRCATFHLEPAIIAYEKVFTITNSHADEKIKTNRHLIEYLHLKAEICWTNLEELINFAAQMYYEVAKKTYAQCQNDFNLIIDEKKVKEKLAKLNPKNHKVITYDKAVKILIDNGIDFEYGKSLTTKQEQFLTKYFDDNFLWVKYIPFTVEGFMFKRKEDNKFLTMTADLIAPCGFGEILGCAEKITNYDELIKSMKEKNKYKDYSRYKDYAMLHKYGLPFHGGIGMGIERALRYLLDLNHVKYTKPFAVIKGSQINH